MIVRVKKTAEGAVLTCIRDNGSVAVQRTGHRGFFAHHDLMHLCVETTLDYRQAFFGLMAAGWSFGTFGDKSDPRSGAIPQEAVRAEHLVGILLREFGNPARADDELLALWAADVNRDLSVALNNAGLPPLIVEAAALKAILNRFEDLATQWINVPVGGHLEVLFPASAADCDRATL